MSINELSELTQQYHNDLAELEQLIDGVSQAEQALQTVEDNTQITYEDMKKQSVELNRQLEKSQFQRKAINNRLKARRAEIIPIIEAEQEAHKEATKQAHIDRRAIYQDFLHSDEWKAWQHKMTAMVALQGGFWETVKRELICRQPTAMEAEQAARDLELWIDDPAEPVSNPNVIG